MERLVGRPGRDLPPRGPGLARDVAVESRIPTSTSTSRARRSVLEACRKVEPGGPRGALRHARPVRPGRRLPVSEETPSDPRGIYEISQLSAEMICRTYTRIHGIRTVPLRLTNVYGPRSQMRHSQFGVVNWFVRLALGEAPHPDLRLGEDPARLPLRGRLRRGAAGRGAGAPGRRRGPQRRPRPGLDLSRGRRDPARDPPGARASSSPTSRPSARRRSPATSSPTSRRSGRLPGWEPRTGLREGLERTVDVLPGARIRVLLGAWRSRRSLRSVKLAAVHDLDPPVRPRRLATNRRRHPDLGLRERPRRRAHRRGTATSATAASSRTTSPSATASRSNAACRSTTG